MEVNQEESRLEVVVGSGCVFLTGYVLLLVALFADSSLILILGALIFLLSFTLIRRLDPSVRRSCSASVLVHVFWLGFVASCLYWDASLTIRLVTLLLSPAGLLILGAALGLGDGLRKFSAYVGRTYQEIQKSDRSRP
jgi:hypothetical protein